MKSFDDYVALVIEEQGRTSGAMMTNIEFSVQKSKQNNDQDIFIIKKNNESLVVLDDFIEKNPALWNTISTALIQQYNNKNVREIIKQKFGENKAPWDITINSSGQVSFNADSDQQGVVNA